MIRDIPSHHVIEGNKRTSLRQDVQRELRSRGLGCECVRCREVRGKPVAADDLFLDDFVYQVGGAEEHFISWVTPDDKLAGFLRLSLPGPKSPNTGMTDLDGAAIIREVHVYGQSLRVGQEQDGAAQHAGLGSKLLQKADEITKGRGFHKMAVISAVGTRQYYIDRGFQRGDFYLVKELHDID